MLTPSPTVPAPPAQQLGQPGAHLDFSLLCSEAVEQLTDAMAGVGLAGADAMEEGGAGSNLPPLAGAQLGFFYFLEASFCFFGA